MEKRELLWTGSDDDEQSAMRLNHSSSTNDVERLIIEGDGYGFTWRFCTEKGKAEEVQGCLDLFIALCRVQRLFRPGASKEEEPDEEGSDDDATEYEDAEAA